VNSEIQELENLREERESLAERVDALEDLHEETSELEAMYGDLRAELRQRNVAELERTLNETFELVYGNDAYSHIELDGEYVLTVYQKDGEPLDPEQLSGGERALFNLSLRCAIYRLLSEGIEGAAPTPPLILDEPTVFLDSGHVSRLVRLVEEMRGFRRAPDPHRQPRRRVGRCGRRAGDGGEGPAHESVDGAPGGRRRSRRR